MWKLRSLHDAACLTILDAHTASLRPKHLGCQQWSESSPQADEIVGLHMAPRCNASSSRSTKSLYGSGLGVQAAFGAPDTSGNRPFFKRLAAVRCAFRCVASIMIRSGLPPLPASSAKISC